MEKVFQLVYVSEAVEDISYTDILEILQVSRRHNQRDEISGILIFREGRFLQLLEGPEVKVRQALGRVLLDERHFSLRVLTEVHSEKRIFDAWFMAYQDGDISSPSVSHIEEIFDFTVLGSARPSSDLLLARLRSLRQTTSDFK